MINFTDTEALDDRKQQRISPYSNLSRCRRKSGRKPASKEKEPTPRGAGSMKSSGLSWQNPDPDERGGRPPGLLGTSGPGKSQEVFNIFFSRCCLPVTPLLVFQTNNGAAVGSRVKQWYHQIHRQMGKRACHAQKYPDLPALPQQKLAGPLQPSEREKRRAW